MKVVTKDKVIEDFAILLEITDAELAFIEEEPKRIKNVEVMQVLMKSRGHNAHIVQLTLNDDISILFNVHRLLKNYDSVSWINRSDEFHIRRNNTALLN